MDLHELMQKRAAAFDAFKALAEKTTLSETERAEYDVKKRAVEDFDDQITRAQNVQDLSARTAKPVAGQENLTVPAAAETDPYVNDDVARTRFGGSSRSLVLGGLVKMLGAGNGSITDTRTIAKEIYGENHPITRALMTSAGAAGGFIVPPDYNNEVIELLRPKAVVRDAGPRVLPMPRGTMQLPGQSSQAQASYGGEGKKISASQPKFDKKVASFKKLRALVPVSNDMMRYADPAVDAVVRDDLVQVLALVQDKNFLLSDGTNDSPRGYLSFANGWVQAHGGTPGVFSTSEKSVLALNGADVTDDPSTSGGNFITATMPAVNADLLTAVTNALAGAVDRLDTAQSPDIKRTWFYTPRTHNFLYSLRNELGQYVYRDEMTRGTLNGYPFRKTSQIGNNWWDASGNKDCSFIFLAEMTETMILDSMSLELAVSREGTYYDASGNLQSAFSNDETLIRAITEHDFQMRHDQSVAIIQGVRWAPSAS
ncbi:MAG: phage major capsid protein [Rhizomicrobium sp.]